MPEHTDAAVTAARLLIGSWEERRECAKVDARRYPQKIDLWDSVIHIGGRTHEIAICEDGDVRRSARTSWPYTNQSVSHGLAPHQAIPLVAALLAE